MRVPKCTRQLIKIERETATFEVLNAHTTNLGKERSKRNFKDLHELIYRKTALLPTLQAVGKEIFTGVKDGDIR